MAAAFVSGAAALLLEERPNLKPLGIKAALQISSSFMPEAGLVRGGTGSLNVLAAAELVLSGDFDNTTIANVPVSASGLLTGISNQRNSLAGSYNSHLASLNACATIAAVIAYDATAGWPF